MSAHSAGERAFPVICLLLFLLGWPLPGQVRAAEPLRLEIEGVAGEVLANVQAALALPPGLVRDGTVDRRWLERFVRQVPDKVRRALEAYGYYSPAIRTELVTVEPNAQLLKVLVEPGRPVRLSEVHIALEGPGAGRRKLNRLREGFPLQSGDVLHQGKYQQAKNELQDQAVALGYLDASYRVHEIRIDPEKHSAEIALVLSTGPRYRFGEVRFSGAEDYPEPFLRRYLAFATGDVFSYTLLGQSQLNYLDSDRFDEIRLLPERDAAEENHIPVEAVLHSKPPKRLRPGIGYGTDTGARATLQFENLNLFHRGHELHLELNLSQVRQTVGAAYVLPDLKNLHSSTAFRTGYEAEDTDTFDTEKYTVEAERTRDFGRGRKGSVYLRLLLEDFTVGDQRDTSRMLIPGVRYSRRRYREIVRPSKGHQYALEVRGGHQYLGSDTGLLQLLASGNVLFSLPARLSLFLRVEGGTTLQNEPLEDIPVSLRFFAGGDQSVRGYAYQSLGPENDEGDVIGGKHLLVGSIELERAIGKNWGVAAFYDVGNAFNSYTAPDFFQGAGLGVRYYTPVGPVRLDVARQIDVADPSFRIHIGVGFGW
jgi:translocation and assembly module TamA